jgi:two-component system response regulator DegU
MGEQDRPRPRGFIVDAAGRKVCAVKFAGVLVADSHLGMLGGVHTLLDALFETVLMVADERSLVDAIATFKPDQVVLDLSLPTDGEANIARRLMERHPDLRLLVLSVQDEPMVMNQVLRTGVAGFVLKRCAARALISAMEEVLRGARTFARRS